MKLSVEWLKQWIDIDLPPEDLAARLTMIGLTVDAVERPGAGLEPILVGRVDTVEKHPNADRLSVCTVFDGAARHAVVCGAPNVREGGLYPFAPVGAVLPGGVEIREVSIRGASSAGMLCSERELGISDEAAGLMDLPPDAVPGTRLVDHLGLHDAVLEIDVPFNRPDWLSVRGVAREIGAMLGRAVNAPPSSPTESDRPASASVRVVLESLDDCPLYGARIVRGVTIGPSPSWLRRRLEAIGLRSINNVVDVTNYVLHSYGQPIHAFDLSRLRGGEIGVRRARSGERLVTLDGVAHTLTPEALVIVDGEGAVALAGIMGGESSEVREETTDLLLESAEFSAPVIRAGARRLAMDTDAALRFGRGVDPTAVLTALDHTARWIQEIAGGEVDRGQAVGGAPRAGRRRLTLRQDRLTLVLGKPVAMDEVLQVLGRLGFEPEPADGGTVACVVPPWRLDVEREIDLIEEVARFHGYDRFEERHTNTSAVAAIANPTEAAIRRSAGIWIGFGFQEALTSVFLRPEEAEVAREWSRGEGDVVRLLNAKGRDTSALRTSLWPGQLRMVRRNVNHGVERLRSFEHGKVFRTGSGEWPVERWSLAGVMLGSMTEPGWQGKSPPVDLFTLKGYLDAWFRRMHLGQPGYRVWTGPPFHAGEAFALEHPAAISGCGGRIAPEVAAAWEVPRELFLFTVDFESCLEVGGSIPYHKESSRYPGVKRDLAFVVPSGTTHAELESAIREAGGELVRSVRLFDLYEGEPIPPGKRSLAYAVTFQSGERSLTNAEVDARVEAVVRRLASDFGAELRDF